MEKSNKEPPSMILVMGVTGSGKSTLINQIAGGNVAEASDSVFSCTSECKGFGVDVESTHTLLLDTPGFNDTNMSDSEILQQISSALVAQHEAGFKLKGILYLHRISDPRYDGAAMRTLRMFRNICGEDALKNVVLVTTNWDNIAEEKGAMHEREIRDRIWGPMIEKGAITMRHWGTRDSAIALVSHLLSKESVVLELQRQLIEEGKDLIDTTAGSEINDANEKEKAKLQQEIKELEARRDEALAQSKAGTEGSHAEADAERKELDVELDKARRQEATLKQNSTTEQRHRWQYVTRTREVVELLKAFIALDTSAVSAVSSWFNN